MTLPTPPGRHDEPARRPPHTLQRLCRVTCAGRNTARITAEAATAVGTTSGARAATCRAATSRRVCCITCRRTNIVGAATARSTTIAAMRIPLAPHTGIATRAYNRSLAGDRTRPCAARRRGVGNGARRHVVRRIVPWRRRRLPDDIYRSSLAQRVCGVVMLTANSRDHISGMTSMAPSQ